MISQVFIDRPRLATVIALVTVLIGLLAMSQIGVAQYPQITPPEVQVSASYSGANAEVVANSIAAPIEDQVNGVEDMLYMASSSTNTGSYSLTVTFAIGTDPAIAQVNVQNRVALALPRLPQAVTQTGVSVRTRSTSTLMGIAIFSPNRTRDQLFLSNYATLNVRDALTRLPGVGDANVFGPVYSMRIWMNPDRMQAFGITSADISRAVQAQNALASAGQIGSAPVPADQQLQFTVVAQGRLPDAAAFGRIILRTNPDGGVVRLTDVARVELGAQSYDTRSELNNQPSATLMIYQSPEANALAVSRLVRAELERLAVQFPEDLAYTVVFDTSAVVLETIYEIALTLILTFVLVVLVTYVFLQDWRATLIPTLTIPVSLVGAFAVIYLFGYTANTITLFALVLAIGVVVDDAIIVVENVQRQMEEHSEISAAEASRRAMRQITGPIVSSTLVLAAVFVPIAFMPGITGQLYRQFAVTLSSAVILSGVNALTLSPALCAYLLRPPQPHSFIGFRLFNRALDRSRAAYLHLVSRLSRVLVLTAVILIAIFAGIYGLLRTLPTGFLPAEDQGYLFVNVQLPNAASIERTGEIVDRVTEIARETAGVANVIGVIGSSFIAGAGANVGMAILALAPWSEREAPELRVDAIIGKLRGRLAALPGAAIAVFNPPPIPGLGSTGGFDLRLQATAGQSPQDLGAVTRALIVAANQTPQLAAVFSTYSADVPQILLNIERERAALLGVSPADIFAAMQAHLGSSYIDDFSVFNRIFQVRVQDEARFRNDPGDISRLHVRSGSSELVPIRSLATISTTFGPSVITRYNLFPSATINGQAGQATSTGAALSAMEQVARATLPTGYDVQWTGLALQERQATNQLFIILAMALIFSYLFLVGQFESWSAPLAVMLSVSVAALGALGTLLIVAIPINIYVQIGLVLLIGLAAKNAILIVSFAKDARDEGMPIVTAAMEGTRQRFRPLLMTAFAFVLGVAPLLIATGAGAASRRSIGATVFGGMLVGTIAGVLLIPLLYVLVQTVRERLRGAPKKNPATQI